MDTTMESKGILTSLRDSWRRGRTRRVLSSLDDERLKDIGLLDRNRTARVERPRTDPALARQPALMAPKAAGPPGNPLNRAGPPSVTMPHITAC